MVILSLFDGMSCGQIALNRLGIKPSIYYASEIDKYAIKVTQYNYPNTVQLGSILDWREWDLDWSSVDLITGGFPCQAWSVAGKQLGDKDPRGALFWTMLDIINYVKELNPDVKFLIENVKMKKDFEEYITKHTKTSLGEVNKMLINSALVSAQNRTRYYWSNLKKITLPIDRNIKLSDIVEDGYVDREKSYCIDANYFKGSNIKQYITKSRRQLVFKNVEDLNSVKLCRVDSTLKTDSINYRKLTPLECERLQTVPENYTNVVSNTQRYKMLGNGWTVDVIVHILNELKKELPCL